MHTASTIGLLTPGVMGTRLGAAIGENNRVVWAGDGRSDKTHERAQLARFEDLGTVAQVLAEADAVLSVCPPALAPDLARQVAQHSFAGVFVDANGLPPETVRQMAQHLNVVDAAVVASQPDETRLVLSGPDADQVTPWFAGSNVTVEVIGDRVGAASALKTCFDAWTLGSSSLLMGVRALARAEGVEAPLLEGWGRCDEQLVAQSNAVDWLARNAWRSTGEMAEVAEAFRDVGLPTGFHQAASEVFHRLLEFKEVAQPSVDAVLQAVLADDG